MSDSSYSAYTHLTQLKRSLFLKLHGAGQLSGAQMDAVERWLDESMASLSCMQVTARDLIAQMKVSPKDFERMEQAKAEGQLAAEIMKHVRKTVENRHDFRRVTWTVFVLVPQKDQWGNPL